jgi:hypothetical protein
MVELPPPSPRPAILPLAASPESAPAGSAGKAELMRSVGRLIRGLSAIFWGLPVALVVSVQAAFSYWLNALGPLGCIVPALVLGVLCYGLWLMRDFQKQERVWVLALERAQVLAVVNVGLAPFLYWHHRLPHVPHYSAAVLLLLISGLLFLMNLNRVLRRLAALLPDETVRTETAVFTSLNGAFFVLLPLLAAGYVLLARAPALPLPVIRVLEVIEPIRLWLFLLPALLPVAITMSLTWKIKEVLLAGVFGEAE